MSTIYERIQSLCEKAGISGAKMCAELGMSKSFMTELKMGRSKSIKLDTAVKIAEYFNVPTEALLDDNERGGDAKKAITDDDIQFALFGGRVTDEAYEDVKRFAAFIKEKYGDTPKGK